MATRLAKIKVKIVISNGPWFHRAPTYSRQHIGDTEPQVSGPITPPNALGAHDA
jgi:hypothetical protein